MRAVICRELKGLDGLALVEDWPEPATGPGDVIVEVEAVALNFPDVLQIQGLYQDKPKLPFVPGMELAGVVQAVAPDVTRLSVGDRVIATCTGALAQRVKVPAAMVMPSPAGLEPEQAAGVSVTYLTTIHALKQRAQLQPGETLLVLGAAGGVGTSAVELGKVMGATVIAAASSAEKLETAKALGADHLIDYSHEDLKDRLKQITGGKGVDVVYDPVGGPYTEPALRSMAWKGRYLVIGFAAGEIPKVPINLALLKGCSIVGVYWGSFAFREPEVQRQNIRELWSLFQSGKLKPLVGEVHEFDDFRAAFESLMQRRARGKVVIRV